MVAPDDLTAYRRMQQGLQSPASNWVEMHRNYGQDQDLGDRRSNVGTSDLDMRSEYAAWRKYMLAEVA